MARPLVHRMVHQQDRPGFQGGSEWACPFCAYQVVYWPLHHKVRVTGQAEVLHVRAMNEVPVHLDDVILESCCQCRTRWWSPCWTSRRPSHQADQANPALTSASTPTRCATTWPRSPVRDGNCATASSPRSAPPRRSRCGPASPLSPKSPWWGCPPYWCWTWNAAPGRRHDHQGQGPRLVGLCVLRLGRLATTAVRRHSQTPGEVIGQRGHLLIYGGTPVGLMGAVACAVQDIGIGAFVERETPMAKVTETTTGSYVGPARWSRPAVRVWSMAPCGDLERHIRGGGSRSYSSPARSFASTGSNQPMGVTGRRKSLRRTRARRRHRRPGAAATGPSFRGG
jgi:hypothetical protein